jgi:dolichol-phosphate mannosyltransferase
LVVRAAERGKSSGWTPEVSIIVPTFNEAPNVPELVRQIGDAVADLEAEVVFVDDSTDDTAEVVRRVAESSTVPVRLIRREHPVGGLSGAVREGLRSSTATWCLVMDGDLQHPPEMIPVMLAEADEAGVDVVVASRYLGEGSSGGLANAVRRMVSRASTSLTRAMFPIRLADCSDPMTGFFAVRREAIDLSLLQPRGFKILLEILARHRLAVAEVPFVFGRRFAGESKASVRQGLHFLRQLMALRFGRMSRFAVIGGFGAVVNVGIVAALTSLGMGYLVAALIAAESTILMNFFLQERFVFGDLRHEGHGTLTRFAQSVTFNNIETVVRLPVLALLVQSAHIASVPATAVTLLAAFLVRFVFHARVVYRPRRSSGSHDVGIAQEAVLEGRV